MTKELGSVAQPTQGRLFGRPGRGTNGRNVQLDKLGDLLTAPTHRAQKCFAPSNGLSLPDNVLAPAPKKCRNNKKKTLPPPTASQPRRQLLPDIDPRLGFCSPHPPTTPSSVTTLSHQLSPPPRPSATTTFHQPSLPPRPSTTTFRQPSLSPRPSVTMFRQPSLSPPSPAVTMFHQPSPSPRPSAIVPPPPHPSAITDLLPAHSPPSDSEPQPDSDDLESEGSDVDEMHEPDIDERSDDEDDRAAHELLRAAPTVAQDPINPQPVLQYDHQGFAELGNDNSVLQAYYAQNRKPKAPSPSSIHRTPSAKLRPQQPPPEKPANVTRTFSSYPREWQEVISNAKLTFRAYIAGKNGFPDPVKGINEARECLDDALAVHLERGRVVERGHHINKDMIMLVYAESWLLRSQLKTDIRTQVRNLKSLFPDQFTGTAQDLQLRIRENVRSWVHDGSYLHDTVPGSDDQVHFAHPIIASTAKSFYFDKWNCISTSDPDTFKGSVPKPLIALIVTVFRNALDEWSHGRPSTLKLEQKAYGPVYQDILCSMAIVEGDAIDGPRFRERLTTWAGFGMSMNSQAATTRLPTTIALRLSSR